MSDHDHTHGDGADPYRLDQLCLVALSAAFGCICLALYFLRRDILELMLAGQFHLFILVSGFALVLLALARGGVLWFQVGKLSAPGRKHRHHDHEGCYDCHDHQHHQTEPAPANAHSHGGHDHSWAPWRYVVLLVPVVLFLIGLPNKGPQVQAGNLGSDLGREEYPTEIPTFLALGPPSLEQLGIAAKLQPYFRAKAPEIEFMTLEGCARTQELQQVYKNKVVSVRGQFAPDKGGNSRVFALARFRINCCAPDAIQLNVPMVARQSIQHVNPGEWILVTGEIDFVRRGPEMLPILRVQKRTDVVKATPDVNPYLKN